VPPAVPRRSATGSRRSSYRRAWWATIAATEGLPSNADLFGILADGPMTPDDLARRLDLPPDRALCLLRATGSRRSSYRRAWWATIAATEGLPSNAAPRSPSALTACLRLDLFGILADGPMTPDDLARRLDLPPDRRREGGGEALEGGTGDQAMAPGEEAVAPGGRSGRVYAQVLTACLRLDLFGILADGPMTPDDLARRLDLSYRRAWWATIAATEGLPSNAAPRSPSAKRPSRKRRGPCSISAPASSTPRC
jgi:hypothetical protein